MVKATLEQKLKAIERLEAGIKAGEIAKDFGCSSGVIYSWRKKLAKRATPRPRTTTDTSLDAEALKLENETLRKMLVEMLMAKI